MDVSRLALVAVLAACADPDPGWPGHVAPIDDGLARTPPMGWSSWNAFGCDIDAAMIRAQADALVETGLRDLGYVYVNVDTVKYFAVEP